MKRLRYIYLFVSFVIILTVYKFSTGSDPEDKSHLNVCRKDPKTRGASLQSPSLNYRGLSLISNSTDSTDIVLCPGDFFGDLNNTYVTVQDCVVQMYNQDQLIWTSKRSFQSDDGRLCALSLQKDGNLVLYKEIVTCYVEFSRVKIWPIWDSKTDFHPKKTEMKIQDQQLQVIHTLQDGTQRLFFTGENIKDFEEDLGAPRQVAEQFFIKSHIDTKDDIILKRNEYIGNLNGMHLILQSNCELLLKDKNQTIWSFTAYSKLLERCALSVQGNSIGLPKVQFNDIFLEGMNILPQNDFAVIQSNITLQGSQLFIIQTLKNGSQITFYSEPGQDNGLKLKRDLRQIAKNNMTISSETIIRRMDYIGDLNGLHLLLQDNCQLKLANGQQELWSFHQHSNDSFMECSIEYYYFGGIRFKRLKNNQDKGSGVEILGKKYNEVGSYPPRRLQLFLENNMMTMTLQYRNDTPPDVYYAGPNTDGTWLKFLSEGFKLVNEKETKNKIFREMNYIGDINGVYAMLDRQANFILKNKTQVMWESGSGQGYEGDFGLALTRDGNLAIDYRSRLTGGLGYCFWRTQTSEAYKQAELATSELLVKGDGLWLINTYIDGVVKKFKAQEGTNNFTLVSNENEIQVSLPSQIYKI